MFHITEDSDTFWNKSRMETSIEDSLFQAVLVEDQDAVSNILLQGANPIKTLSHGRTCLGEAANIGNIDVLKLLINAIDASILQNTTSGSVNTQIKNKCHKRKLRHHGQHEETVIKCKNLSDRNFKDNNIGITDNTRQICTKADKNQGYFIYKHSEGSSNNDGRTNSMMTPISPTSLTPSPQADLEWDEEIGNVAATTSEDETWSSMYKWYAVILESTGAAIASVPIVSNGIDQQDVFMRTALHYAAEQGHREVVKLLIEAGCKVDITAADSLTALHVAAIKNHAEIVKMLLKAGSNVNYKTYDKMTALHFAASRGFLDVIKVLVNNGAYLESRDTNERTALYLAAGRGHADVVQYLIVAGANVNGEEIHGYTPLCEAVWQRYAEVVDTLLSSGARITHSQQLLHNAIKQRQVEIVKLLINVVGSINLHSEKGETPLLLAASLSQLDIVKLLLSKGANVNSCNSITGSCALHIAVEHVSIPEDFEELLKCLLEYKIDMNATSITGDTALNRALLLEIDHAAVLLIRYGADVNTCDLHSCGLDNLSIACRNQSFALVSMLLKAGHYTMIPDPSATVPQPGSTAHWLYHACRQPLDLTDLCRIKIRSMAGSRILYCFIHSLPLPKSLKRFLMMEDEGKE